MSDDDLDGKPRTRAYTRACGCSKAGPHVQGRCALAPPLEMPLLATTCVCCGYSISRARCGRCGTAAAEVQP